MSASTGNLDANVGRLTVVLRSSRFPYVISKKLLREADPRTILPILHFSLLDLSPHVASFVRERGFQIFALNDAKFTEAAFRLATMHLGIKPHMTVTQFLSEGYTERRLIFAADLLKACMDLHEEAERRESFKRRGPVPPYAGHLMLVPTAASTRDHIRAQSSSTVSRGTAMDADDVFPQRAFSYPSVKHQTRGHQTSARHVENPTDHIYSIGVSTKSRNDGEFTARLNAFESDTESIAARFLSEAILLGQGVGSAMAAAKRRKD